MTKYLLALITMLVPSIAFGSPFLTCDPYPPEDKVDQFVVMLDGVETISAAVVLEDGSTVLQFDLAGIKNGAHNVQVKAKNMWGESVYSVPFDFLSGPPTPPSSINITR